MANDATCDDVRANAAAWIASAPQPEMPDACNSNN
jgi:hypothetical protein